MNNLLRTRCLALIGLALLLGLSGCDQRSEQNAGQTTPATAAPVTRLPGEDDILVRVEGEPITAYELQQAMRAMLGPQQTALLDAKGRRKVLESLVLSRLMAIRAESEIEAPQRRAIETATRAHREQLLVARYLKQHAAPVPVSEDEVKAYYDAHPEVFGGGVLRRYEMLMQVGTASGGRRDKILKSLRVAAADSDWQNAAQTSGGAIAFRTGEVKAKLLLPPLMALLDPLKVGEVSAVTYIQGRAYVARISDQQQREARPLAEVRAQIRRALAPLQLRKAVQQVSRELLQNARVDYVQTEITRRSERSPGDVAMTPPTAE